MNFSNRMPLQRPSNMSPQQLASTPSNQRFFLPRFGHSNIPSYPRPRSSASKPNPDCSPLLEDPFDSFLDLGPHNYSQEDSMRNNFGSSREDDSFANGDSSFQSPNSSAYYSCYDSFIDSPAISPEDGMMNNSQHFNANTPHRFQPRNANTPQRFQPRNANTPQRFQPRNTNTPQRFQEPNDNTYQRFQQKNENTYPRLWQQNEDTYSRFPQQNDNTYSRFPRQNDNTYQSFQQQNENSSQSFKSQNANTPHRFQPQNANNGFKNKSYIIKKNFVKKKPFSFKKNPVNNQNSGPKSVWQCSVCSIKFTSGIPYDMHLRGVKHARKLKFVDADVKVQEIVKEGNGISATGTSFRCDLCDVVANSSLQFMTHLEGSKHKMKVAGATGDSTEPVISKEEGICNEKISEPVLPKGDIMPNIKNPVIPKEVLPNEKSSVCVDTSAVRRVEINSVQNRPTKFSRLACDICCVVVNSNTQLQQHLSSKKHQAKVEGKPLQPRKKPSENKEKKEVGEQREEPSTENSTEKQP